MIKVSPSQISSFRRCKRKWWWEKVQKVEVEPSESAKLGQELHSELEKYFNGKGKLGKRTEVGVGSFPEPSDHLLVEEKFEFMGFRGIIDLYDPKTQKVYDHKTTSNFKWAKTEEELRYDPQAILYSCAALALWDATAPIHFQHIYYRTKGLPACEETIVSLDEKHLEVEFEKICEVAEDMKNYRDIKEKDDVPVNLKACGDFGGCPHLDRCELSPFHKLKLNREDKMANKSFAALLKERKKTINPPTEEAEVEAPIEEEEPKPAPKKRGRPKKEAKKVEAKEVTVPAPVAGAPSLYINCIPRHQKVEYLEEIVQDIMREVAEEAALPHYSLMPYNEGPKRVVALLSNKVELGEMALPKRLVVHTSFPFANPCLEYLMSKYTNVIERSY